MAGVDISRLGIEVSSAGIKEATSDLDKLTTSAGKAEQAASTLKDSSKSLATTQKATADSSEKLIAKFQQQVDLFGANSEKAFSYKAAAKGLSDAQVDLARNLGAQVDGLKAAKTAMQEQEKQIQASWAAWDAYSKAQGQAIEMNKKFDARTQAAQIREAAAAAKEQEAAIRADAKAFDQLAAEADKFTASWGQAIEMDKRFNRQRAAKEWKDLGLAQAEANAMNRSYDASIEATQATLRRTEAQQRSFIAALKDQAATANMTTAELMAYRAAQLGVSDQAAPFIKKMQDAEKALGLTGVSAKQTAFAFKMLPAQMSDIMVQLAGGQNPFLILLQQGSQIKDSFGGLSNTFKALTSAITPVRLVVGGLAATVATLGYAYYTGSQELQDFNKQMILTNGYAGITKSQFIDVSASLASIGVSKNTAAKALTDVAASGQFAASNIELVTKAALQMQVNTGQAVEKTIDQFKAIEKDPVKAVQTLNEQYHFLTAAVLEQISRLEQQGEHEEAVRVAAEAFASTIDRITPKIQENLSVWEKGWRAVKLEAIGLWDAVSDIGRDKSLDQRIKDLQNSQTLAQGGKTSGVNNGTRKLNSVMDYFFTDSNKNTLDMLQMEKQMSLDNQAVVNEQTKVTKDATDAFAELDKKLQTIKGPEKLAKDIANVNKQFADLKRGNPGSDILKGVNFDDAGNPLSGGAYQKIIDELKRKDIRKTPTNENDINQELQKYQNQLKLEEKAYKSYADQMKLMREANSIDQITYLDNLEEAERNSLEKRIKILGDERDVAAKKKNKTAMERINGEIAVLEQQLNDNLDKYGLARKAVWDKDAANFLGYVETLQNGLKTRQQAINDALAGTTLGDVAKGEMQRALAAQKEYDAKVTELFNKREKGTISDDLYNKELEATKNAYAVRLQMEDQFNKDSASLRADWTNGATSALNTYLESVQDVAGQTKTIFASTFSGWNDALTDFIVNGNNSFGSFAKNVIAQIVKMQVAAASSSLFSFITKSAINYFGGGSSVADSSNLGMEISQGGSEFALGGAFESGIQKFAAGGSFANGIVDSPTNFNIGQMGEAGPEAIVPLTRTSDGSLGVTMKGGNSGSINPVINTNITINSDGTATTEVSTKDRSEQAKAFADAISQGTQREINKQMMQGGSLWKWKNGGR